MRYALFVAILAIQLGPRLFAQSVAAAEGEVRQMVTDLVNAELKPSAKELNRFYVEEFVATNAHGWGSTYRVSQSAGQVSATGAQLTACLNPRGRSKAGTSM